METRDAATCQLPTRAWLPSLVQPPTMIVGLVSTYREGSLAISAVRSLLTCCDAVRVMEGPIGPPTTAGKETAWGVFAKDQRVIVHAGEFGADAEKRTALLNKTRRMPTPTWGVILDGDEALIWGEYLRDQIERMQDADPNATGQSLRIMESDGSVAQINARILRLDLVDSYVHSSYHLRFWNGTEAARPNFLLRLAGQTDLPPHKDLIDQLSEQIANGADDDFRVSSTIRDLQRELETGYIQRRRPLQGEPHILHRSVLRAASRAPIPRMSAVEQETLAKSLNVRVETGEGIPVWTPT